MEDKMIHFLRALILETEVPRDFRDQALLLYEQAVLENSQKSIDGHPVSLEDYNAAREQVLSNKKIHAIKILRDATGLGLKESKDAIDNEFHC